MVWMKVRKTTIESEADAVKSLLLWYDAAHRDLPWRRDRDPYHIWLSEIMLQQTRVAAVIGYYERFLRELPDIRSLAEVEEEKLLKLWEGLGYYNRARNLKKAAAVLCDRYDGVFPKRYEEILSLPGIGSYTAGAIASICFGEPTPAVDGNVLRVYTRFMGDASCVDQEATKKAVREKMIPLYTSLPAADRGKLTQAWMELGATVCVPNGPPLCDGCPLRDRCFAGCNSVTDDYPVRAEKKRRREEERTVFVLIAGDRFALHKRPQNGLLAGLWEFPNIEGKLSVDEAVRQTEDWGLHPTAPWMELPYTHIFSHVEWHMTAYFILCDEQPDRLDSIGGITWFRRDTPEEVAAVPSAFRPFLKVLQSQEEHS